MKRRRGTGIWSVEGSIYEGFGASIQRADAPFEGPSETVALVRDYRDAAVMSAAPELLDALKEARERMVGGSPSIRALADKTDAAIAKAEGRTP